MTQGIAGRCDCPLGRHHSRDCPNFIDVHLVCPCPACEIERTLDTLRPPP